MQPILDEIDKILDNNLFDDCVLGGDLNFDQRRGSGFAACLRDFLDRIGLKSVWEKFPPDFTHLHTDLKVPPSLTISLLVRNSLTLLRMLILYIWVTTAHATHQ